MPKSITYSDAGVSIDAANAAVERIKRLARGTFNARTLSEIGSFGGMFDGAFPGLRAPVLVASADGVGTKLKLAFMTGVHDTVGRDLVSYAWWTVVASRSLPSRLSRLTIALPRAAGPASGMACTLIQ